ncbi:DUF4411 family protein [Oceanispirochaeta sp. M1]|uniref:DUF4411 family protein n=2 Tax=Oceanispirochaeta TaxID=2035349 RepID=UPI0013142C74|nr:DUF4411 family protein [Oceanispirochaeta sp. M1]
MKYCIDSCSLITLKNDYRQSVFPKIWIKFEELLNNKTIVSSFEVFEELKTTEDDKAYLLASKYEDCFISPELEIQMEVKRILSIYPNLIRIKERKSGADPWVIATANIYDLTVITEEQHAGNLEYPRIPDVCDDLDCRHIRLIDLFEEENFES